MPSIFSSNGADVSQVDDTTYRIDRLTIRDFQPVVDRLVLDTSTQSDGYTLETITLGEIENANGPVTEVILSFQNPESFSREGIVTLQGAQNVRLEDIVLEGADPSILVPLAETVQNFVP